MSDQDNQAVIVIPPHGTVRQGAVVYLIAALPDHARPPEELLSADEKARMQAFRSEARRLSFALGRNTLRQVAGKVLGLPPAGVGLEVDPSGAVNILGDTIYGSIAHTAANGQVLAAAAVAETPVGVDVEAVKPRDRRLRARIAHPEDLLVGFTGDDLDLQLVALWAAKEATLKARRSGFRLAARSVRVELDAGTGSGRAVTEEGDAWRLRLEQAEGAVLVIASAL